MNGDALILKFSLLMVSFQAVWRLLKSVVILLVGIGSRQSHSFETIRHSERSSCIFKTLCYCFIPYSNSDRLESLGNDDVKQKIPKELLR